LPAVLIVASVTGCSGSGSITQRTFVQPRSVASDATRAAAFERFRAAFEQSVRSRTPAGYRIEVGSTYVTKRGRLAYSDGSVVMKTSTRIGFAGGSRFFVYDRNQLDEIPGSFIKAIPPSRQASTVHPICDPSAGDCPGSDPTPPPDPTPTAPRDPTFDATGSSTPSSDALATARGNPCTQDFSNNGYPNSYMEWTNANTNTWTLHYIPGGPYYAGGIDDITGHYTLILADGTTTDTAFQGGFAPENVDHTVSVIWRDDIRKLQYVAITLYDYVPNYFLTNTVYSYVKITCPQDNGLISAPQPPGPTDPPGGNGNGGGWGNKVMRPQPPR
jgi:hypothetical protein